MEKFFKYITENDIGFTTYDSYFEYIESNKKLFPRNLYDFASNVSRYDLNSDGTLHDLKIQSLTSVDHSSCELVLCESEYTIKIKYSGVTQQSIVSTEFVFPSRLQLICHEFTISGVDTFTHAVEFDRSLFFSITFAGFEYTEHVG